MQAGQLQYSIRYYERKGILLCFALLALAGCKLEHISRVKLSQMSNDIQTIQTAVRIEVPSCTHYEDKTKPSKSLLDTAQLVEQLFSDAEFDGCQNEGLESIATYLVPMQVGTVPPDAKDYTPKGISIIRNNYDVVFFALSEDIRQKISEAKKNAMTKDLKFNVIIKFINDTNEKLKIFPSAVYVDDIAFAGLPAWGNNYTILPKKTATIILSNVASDYVVSNGLVPVFSEAQKQNTKE